MQSNGLGGEIKGKGAQPWYYAFDISSKMVLSARTDTEPSFKGTGQGDEERFYTG